MTKQTIPSISYMPELEQGNVKAAVKAIGGGSSDLWQVDPRELRVLPDFNIRLDSPQHEAKIEWLTDQMIEHGYKQDKPIAAFVAKEDGKDVLYITDGHTRHKAVMRAIAKGKNIERVPVVVKPRGTDMVDLTLDLVTSNSGEPLTPLEVGIVCKRLIGNGLDAKEIARRLGYTPEYVNSLLDLVAAPAELKKMVTEGKVAPSLAVEEVKKHGGKGATERIKAAVKVAEADGKGKVTKRHVEAAANGHSTAKRGANPAPAAKTTTVATPRPVPTSSPVKLVGPKQYSIEAVKQIAGNVNFTVVHPEPVIRFLQEFLKDAGVSHITFEDLKKSK